MREMNWDENARAENVVRNSFDVFKDERKSNNSQKKSSFFF